MSKIILPDRPRSKRNKLPLEKRLRLVAKSHSSKKLAEKPPVRSGIPANLRNALVTISQDAKSGKKSSRTGSDGSKIEPDSKLVKETTSCTTNSSDRLGRRIVRHRGPATLGRSSALDVSPAPYMTPQNVVPTRPAGESQSSTAARKPPREYRADDLLTPSEVAGYLGISEKTLANHRSRGPVPGKPALHFVKAHGRVRYFFRDVSTFLEKSRRASTSECREGEQ